MAIQEEEILDITNEGFAVFYIRVTDESGKGLGGVHIECDGCMQTSGTETDDRGNVTVYIDKREYPDVEYDGLTVSVYKNGYYAETKDSIYVNTKINPEVIVLRPKTGIYYYVAYVRDINGNAIPNATVKAYDSGGSIVNDTSVLTDIYGKYPLSMNITDPSLSDDEGVLYFEASKNGYEKSTRVSIYPNSSAAAAEKNAGIIVLTEIRKADYYYSIKVENEYGEGVPDAEVCLYRDFDKTTVYSVNDLSSTVYPRLIKGYRTSTTKRQTQDEIFGTVREIVSDMLGVQEGRISKESLYSDFDPTTVEMTRVITSIEKRYGIQIRPGKTPFTAEERVEWFMTTYPHVNDIVPYISENTDWTLISYKTGNDGYLIVEIGKQLPERPSPIYVKGIGNVWTVGEGTATAGKDEDPSVILKTSPSIRRNYGIRVIDTYTKKAVKDVDVTYLVRGTIMSSMKTNSSGTVDYGSSAQELSVTIHKDGYEDETIYGFHGTLTSGEYTVYEIIQSNPVRVIYGYGERSGEGAEGILVSIGYYDSGRNYVERGRYKTYKSGYIDCIGSGYFTSSGFTYYAIVLDYVPKDDILRQSLKKVLVRGGVVIELPEPFTGDDGESEEYIKFYDMSAYAIKRNITEGNNEIRTKGESDKVSYSGGDDYRINIVNPDSVTAYDIFQSKPVMMDYGNRNVIGSIDIGLKYDVNRLSLKVINRYSGYYNPIFKDILFYGNSSFGGNEMPYSNTTFDDTYTDGMGRFGIINDMWFHKVNDDNGINILDTMTPYYPLTGRYALDYRDYNIFESNWDFNHYTKQLDLEHSRPCPNIGSQKDGLCMFGSKYLNVPDKIELYGLTLGSDSRWNGEWNDDWITSQDACPGEIMFKEVNGNSVDFYFFLTKRLHRFFYDKLKDEFERYINPDTGSYGTPGIEDDIREYVEKNVFRLYRLEKVRMFVKRTKKNVHDSMIENDYTKYLEYDKTCGDSAITEYFDRKGYVQYFRQHGFVEVDNITLSKINRNDFDRKLVYNLRNGSKEEFGFGFIFRKI